MNTGLTTIVTGQIAQYPLGGVTWFYIQYLLGLKQLGHEVYYIEDSGQWPFSPLEAGLTKDPTANIQYLANALESYGLGDRWSYRYPKGKVWHGLNDSRRREIIESADILINVSGTLEHPEEYRSIPLLVYIDTDPVFTQIKLARGQADYRAWVDSHDIHFSFGERIGSDLPHNVPDTGIDWIPTRAPVVISEWNPDTPFRDVYTTVMNWTSHNSMEYEDKSYGQKDVEFGQFITLPKRVEPIQIEVAAGAGKNRHTPYDLLKYNGWQIVNPDDVCPDLESFRDYTQSSRGEWSIAKNGYVLGQSGWFSERSARYLAAGRPVVAQETGFTGIIPTGEGLLSYTNLEEAVAAISEVERDYERHAKAARRIAETHFDSDKVLGDLVNTALKRKGDE